MKSNLFLFLRKILYVAVFLSVTVPSFSQKISFRSPKVKYTQLPLHPLGKEIKTYHSNVKLDLPEPLMQEPALKSPGIRLNGYEPVREADEADIRIDLFFDQFSMKERKRISDKVYHVNTASNETGYYDLLTFDFPAELIVSTADHHVLLREEIHPDSTTRILNFGKWTFSEEDLNHKFNTSSDELSLKIEKDCALSVLKRAGAIVNDNYGFPVRTEHIKIAVVKGKKNDFQDLTDAEAYFESAMDGITKSLEEEKINSALQHALDIWNKIISMDQNKPIGYNLKMMLLYNCAQASLWMNHFEDALAYAREAEIMINDNVSGKYTKVILPLRTEIEDRAMRFHANNPGN